VTTALVFLPTDCSGFIFITPKPNNTGTKREMRVVASRQLLDPFLGQNAQSRFLNS
jgi:hypothetical protein